MKYKIWHLALPNDTKNTTYWYLPLLFIRAVYSALHTTGRPDSHFTFESFQARYIPGLPVHGLNDMLL